MIGAAFADALTGAHCTTTHHNHENSQRLGEVIETETHTGFQPHGNRGLGGKQRYRVER